MGILRDSPLDGRVAILYERLHANDEGDIPGQSDRRNELSLNHLSLVPSIHWA